MCSMVVCVLVNRLPLIAALGSAAQERLGELVAVAPEPGRDGAIGDVSPAAEAFGVAPGMRVGGALTRCPELTFVPADPEATRDYWNAVIDRIEALGAAVESDEAGTAWFEAAGLERLHGRLEGVLVAVRRTLPARVRLGVAPSRFAAHAAALNARPGRPRIVQQSAVREFLGPLPVSLLRSRPGLDELPELLERLGIGTLG